MEQMFVDLAVIQIIHGILLLHHVKQIQSKYHVMQVERQVMQQQILIM